MNPQQTNIPSQPGLVSVLVPWLLFAVAAVPYFWSVAIAVGESGDPPNRGNDWVQQVLIAGWLLLFAAAICTAWLTRDRPTFAGVTTFCFVLSVWGLFFVL